MEQMPPEYPRKSKLGRKQVLIVIAACLWPGLIAALFAAMDAEGPLSFALAVLLTMPAGFALVVYLTRQRRHPNPDGARAQSQ